MCYPMFKLNTDIETNKYFCKLIFTMVAFILNTQVLNNEQNKPSGIAL